MLHQDLICEEPVLADNTDRAFTNMMKDYQLLTDSVRVSVEDDEPDNNCDWRVVRKETTQN